MRVSKDDEICGVPAPTARQLMRAYHDDHTVGVACEVLDLDREAAQVRLVAFEAEGYLRRVENGISSSVNRWVTTIQGNALAQASFGKPISRATADRHLAQVIARTRAYNADPSRLLTISEIAVFGSYLDPKIDCLGDLDLAVIVVRRDTDGNRYVDKVLAYAQESGRSFGVFIEQLLWPLRELRMILKNRSVAISITDEDVRKLTDRYEIVYVVGDDPAAIPPPPDAMVQR
jgi:predicted nucleotidyltransferase